MKTMLYIFRLGYIETIFLPLYINNIICIYKKRFACAVSKIPIKIVLSK